MKRQFMRSTGRYSQTPKGPFYENFRFCETENREKLCIKVFGTRNFKKYRRVPPTKLFGTMRKKRCDKNVIPLLSIVFRYQKHSETHRACSRNFSRQKVFQNFFDTPLSDQNFSTRQKCSARNFQKLPDIQKGTPYKFFCTVKKISQLFLVIPSDDLPKLSHRTDE